MGYFTFCDSFHLAMNNTRFRSFWQYRKKMLTLLIKVMLMWRKRWTNVDGEVKQVVEPVRCRFQQVDWRPNLSRTSDHPHNQPLISWPSKRIGLWIGNMLKAGEIFVLSQAWFEFGSTLLSWSFLPSLGSATLAGVRYTFKCCLNVHHCTFDQVLIVLQPFNKSTFDISRSFRRDPTAVYIKPTDSDFK